jgi:hypothetical protein
MFGDTPIGIVGRAFGGTLHSHSEIKAACAQKGPEGPLARLHSTDFSQNIRRIQIPGDRSLVAPWVWMTALH